ncbi:TonB-dependent receptor [hydrothermal vent metagenome]|uniref:TonB-dependent receptor n=1 Tax=hydrothermal vent metagenome TaxID=652676 RepID=A0A3B0WH26_9ZZZZ
MKMKLTPITSAIKTALLTGFIASSAFGTAAFAQAENSDDESVEEQGKMTVTGTRIKRLDMETSVPVQVFDAEFIEASGAPTLQDFLFQSNIAGPGLFNENTTLSQQAGTANFDARGFGSSYVVVLLNGRRLPGDPLGGGSATNINLVPLGAIERIEYLSDGASAIYGADAISGVVNIITKTGYDGANINLRFGTTSENDGEVSDISLAVGGSSDKGSVTVAFNWAQQDDIDAGTRPLIRSAIAPDGTDGRSPTGLPGTFLDFGAGISYPDPNCPDGSARPAQFTSLGEDCAFDFAPLYDAVPAQTRQSILATGDYQLSDNGTAYGEFRFSRNVTEVRNGAAPAFFDITGSQALIGVDAQLGTDLFNSDSVFILRRSVDAGPRATDNTNTALSAVIGYSYLFGNHEVDVSYQAVDSEQNRVGVGGQVSISALEAAVASGLFDPTEFYDPNFYRVNGLTIATQRQAIGNEDTLDLGMNGFFELGFGNSDLGYAVGYQYKDQSFVDRADVASSTGDVAGGASSNGAGQSEVNSIYGELSFSPFEGVELGLAGRSDDYDWGNDFSSGGDSQSTFRLSGSWRPTDNFMVRGSLGTGFKAPTLGNLFLGRSFGVTRAVDTQLCNAAIADPGSSQADIDNACRSLEIRSVSGGNPDLETEESDSYSFGMVFEPIDNLSFTVDYYNIEVNNKIGSLGVQEIIDNEALFPDLITRVNGSLSPPDA